MYKNLDNVFEMNIFDSKILWLLHEIALKLLYKYYWNASGKYLVNLSLANLLKLGTKGSLHL